MRFRFCDNSISNSNLLSINLSAINQELLLNEFPLALDITEVRC